MKKILTIALAAAMVLVLVPTVAFAATTEAGSASELATAITNAGEGDTIQLTADIDIDGVAEMEITKALTIDMKGYSISGVPSGSRAFRVVGGALTLDNTSATQSSLLVGTGETDEYSYEGIRIAGSGNATINANVSIETGCPVVVQGNGTPNSAQLDVYGRTITSACLPSGDAYSSIQGRGNTGMGGTVINIYDGAEVINEYTMAMYIPQDGIVNVYGGTITGVEAAIGIKAGTLNISGGTIRATGESNIPTDGWSSGINGSGCAIQIESNDGYVGNVIVNITGGTISSDHAYAIYEYLDSGNTDTEVIGINIANATLRSAASSSMMISEELGALSEERIIIAESVTFETASASEVTANADVSYMVVIPSSVDFGTIYKSMDAQSRQFIVAVEDALIEDGSSISVENTTAAMTMKDKDGAGSEELAFTLAQDEAPVNGVFMFAQTDLIDGTESIGSSVGCIPANLTAAGSYKGYMMFEVSYNTAD